jgi:hypothetical protein
LNPTGASNKAAIPINDTLRHLINSVQIYQSGSDYRQASDLRAPITATNLINKWWNTYSDDSAYVMSLKFRTGGHAVIPYRISEGLRSGWISFVIYDPNSGTSQEWVLFILIQANSNMGLWDKSLQ